MFEKMEQKEVLSLLGIGVLLLAVGFAGGKTFQSENPTGKMVQKGSKQKVMQRAQDFMDKQLVQQRKRLEQVANRSENLSEEDISIGAEVNSVNPSSFESLYQVNVTVSGTVPKTMGTGTRTVEQETVLYMSKDGRYLFQKPKDLEAEQKQSIPMGQ